MQTIIYLLRHAESDTNDELTSRGKNQALSLTTSLSQLNIDIIYSSIYKRAVDTVRPFSFKFGISLYEESDFRERKVSNQVMENYLHVLEISWLNFDYKLPKCESASECQTRVVKALVSAIKQNPGKHILISTHGNAISLILHHIDHRFNFEDWKRLNTPDLVKLVHANGNLVWDRDFRLNLDSTNRFYSN